jgi:hypothetical protein
VKYTAELEANMHQRPMELPYWLKAYERISLQKSISKKRWKEKKSNLNRRRAIRVGEVDRLKEEMGERKEGW